MKIYILIEDKENEAEVRIDGNLETLHGLLCMLHAELLDFALVNALPAKDLKQKQGETNATR